MVLKGDMTPTYKNKYINPHIFTTIFPIYINNKSVKKRLADNKNNRLSTYPHILLLL